MTDSINANVVVSMPSQLFTMARSFKAVANGKIYIGKIDTDPVNPENQIQVYVENEDGSHVPVSQPIIINVAGYPVYNGQIAKFVTVQGHSMAVYDAYGAQQFYFPNVLKYDPDQFRQVIEGPDGAYDVGYTTAFNNNEITVGDALDNKIPNIIGSVDAPATGFKFESFKKYSGNHDVRLTDHGSIIKTTKKLKKTGHDTVTLSSTVDPTPPVTVDTVAYVDPTSFEGGFPQEILIEGITFEGDDDGLTEVGLTIHEGQRFQLKNLSFLKVKKAIQIYSWITQLDFIMANGQIHQTGGTSTTYRNVGAWVNDDSVLPGAFRIENAQYSNMVCCTSDGTIRTAYYINNCNGLTMTSCACELPSATDIGMGAAIHFQDGNDSTITDFVCIPKSDEQNPLISFSSNNNVTFNNLMFAWGKEYGWDIYINGPNNHIVLNRGAFSGAGAGSLGLPTVGANAEAIGSTVLYVSKTNKYMARVTSANNILQFEPFIEERSIDNEVALTFGDSADGIAVAVMDCKYHKNGNIVRIDFIVQLNGAGGQTGALRIRNLPWQAKDGASGMISTYSYLSPDVGPISLNIARGSNALEFFKLSSIGTTALTNNDLTQSSIISGSITYSIDSNFNY
ncbi:phage head-binding domain-containing protein [Escherichia coli]|uniref:phage head-binding domain-containing protein n=1 Tax=Escherichia coli TaxID=562 RepID=UPI00202CB5AC|nr:phage head-binding domain-containing protein [Escherichia coli]